MKRYGQYPGPSGSALPSKHFILKAFWRNSPNPGNPTLFFEN
jgi:hypothetical protein